MSDNIHQGEYGRDDVARRAGVSGATVSYVFSHKRYVSPDLVQRVMKAAEELNYHPDMVAAAMRRKSTETIAVLTDDILSPLQMEIVHSIQEEAMENGYFTHICGGATRLENYVNNFISRRVDGVFLSVDPAGVKDDSITRLLDRGISVVITSLRGFSDDRVCGLELDFDIAVRLLVQHLRQLGHTKIAFLSCFDEKYESDTRLPAFKTHMKEICGVSHPLIFAGKRPYESTIDKGYELATRLIESGKEFTAVLCTNDMMALGAMRALQGKGYDIPRDVSVAGIDDILFAKSAYPALTTVSHCSKEYGHRIFRILKRNIDDKNVVSRERIAPTLVVRESTARCSQ